MDYEIALDMGRLTDYLKKGGDVNILDADGWNFLHFACCVWNLESVQKLIEHGINVNQKDFYGRTPLYFQCKTTQVHPILPYLLENGADPKIGLCCIQYCISEEKWANLTIFLDYVHLLSEAQKELLKPYHLGLVTGLYR